MLLDATVEMTLRDHDRIDRLAIDSSGFEAHHISCYYIRRRCRTCKTSAKWQTTTYRRFPKLALAVDCDRHLIVSMRAMRGPSPDIRLVTDAWMKWEVGTVCTDAGYDGEWVHDWLRADLGAASLIRAKNGRPTSKPPSGKWRRWLVPRAATARRHAQHHGGAMVGEVFDGASTTEFEAPSVATPPSIAKITGELISPNGFSLDSGAK